MNPLLRSGALGAATGSRSSYGVAAVSLTSPPGDGRALQLLTSPRGKKVAAVLAGLETVADKLPNTPTRLKPQGFGPRVLFGAGTAVLMAQRDGYDVQAAARVGAGAAAATSVLGVVWRRLGVRGGRRDLSGALIEDAVAAGLAVWGARPTTVPVRL